MTDSTLQSIALAGTVVVQAVLVLAMLLGSKSCTADANAAKTDLSNARVIEASLAYKKTKPKKKQPQKKKKIVAQRLNGSTSMRWRSTFQSPSISASS